MARLKDNDINHYFQFQVQMVKLYVVRDQTDDPVNVLVYAAL